MLSKENRDLRAVRRKGYQVDPFGNVISPAVRIRKLEKVNHGRKEYTYWHFRFSAQVDSQRHCNVWVHRLQAYQKFGERVFEPRMVVRHLDGNSLNNSWENIGIGTRISAVQAQLVEAPAYSAACTLVPRVNRIPEWLAFNRSRG